MKKFLTISVLFLLLSGCDNNKNVEESPYIKETVEKLTSEDMDGRLTGTKGNDLAVKFIEEQYEDIGLEFLSEKDEFLLKYPHKFHDPKNINFEVTVTSPKGEVFQLERGTDFLERNGFTDYHANYPFTFDIKDPNIDNSFVVLKDSNDFQAVFEKAQGFLVVEEYLHRTLSMDAMDKPIIQITKETYELLNKQEKGKIEISSTSEVETIQAFNVVGKIPGKVSSNAVILSAHLDHVGSINDTIYRGAIDNASGVSVLLDVAKKIKESNIEFDKDILFVAFNGEESGLQGSYHFVEYIKNNYEHIYNINIDSVYDGPVDLVSSDEELLEELIGDLNVGLDNYDISARIDTSGGSTSDHSNFLHNHINAVSIGSQNVMKKIHNPLDSSREIDYPFLSRVSEALSQFLIKNNKKLYEHIHPSTNTKTRKKSMEESAELSNAINKEIEKLKYDEYMLFEYKEDETFLLQHRTFLFNELQEFDSFHPDIKYQPSIKDYQLKTISVSNNYKKELDTTNIEVDKIYKRDVLSEDIETISLNYYSQNSPNETIQIEINKMEDGEEHLDEEHEEFVEKEININNKDYTLYYDKEQKHLYSFSFVEQVNNKPISITIYKGEDVTVESEGSSQVGIKTTLTEQEVNNIITTYDLIDTIKQTINTF